MDLELENHQAKQTSCESDTQSNLLQFSWTNDIDFNIVDLEYMWWILYFDVECIDDTTKYEALGVKRARKVFGNYGQNPFQQQIRATHPKLDPLIQKELRKLVPVLK